VAVVEGSELEGDGLSASRTARAATTR